MNRALRMAQLQWQTEDQLRAKQEAEVKLKQAELATLCVKVRQLCLQLVDTLGDRSAYFNITTSRWVTTLTYTVTLSPLTDYCVRVNSGGIPYLWFSNGPDHGLCAEGRVGTRSLAWGDVEQLRGVLEALQWLLETEPTMQLGPVNTQG